MAENECQREMTLDEWCAKLPSFHLVNRQLQELRAALQPSSEGAVAMDVEAWAELHRLRVEFKGPDGFDTWRDAATSERVRRVQAEATITRVRVLAEEWDSHDGLEFFASTASDELRAAIEGS